MKKNKVKKNFVRKFEFEGPQPDGTYVVRIIRRQRINGRMHSGGNVYQYVGPEQLMVIRAAVAKIEAPVSSVRHTQFFRPEVD